MKLTGRITDASTGHPVEARVEVLTSSGHFAHPKDAILKVGPGRPFFYSDGSFAVDVGCGRTRVVVERGTEYEPYSMTVEATTAGTMAVDIPLTRWTTLGEQGWHPGNTHIHYDHNEQRPDERLRLDPRVEDLRVTAISVLTRWDLPYASNKYSPGFLTDFSTDHHYVECGEECRHNDSADSIEHGYGHVMFLRIKDIVEPISRGFLVDETDPDYPPLSLACDEARAQGGLVIWCHNGRGMEAPVAAALGKLDAINLFDPFWQDPEYDLWYDMLNCGITLPASTGSDWFVCSANRVYVDTAGDFEPDAWYRGLSEGRTFVTNGPALFMEANGQRPGDTLELEPGSTAHVTVSWHSFYSVDTVQIIRNGRVVHDHRMDTLAGELSVEIEIPEDGWLAARLASNVRDSFHQPLFAHTSPLYVKCGRPNASAGPAATAFVRKLDEALEWTATKGKYRTAAHQREVQDLFREAQDVYRRWSRR